MRDKAALARAPLKDKAPALAAVDPAVVRLTGALDEKIARQHDAAATWPLTEVVRAFSRDGLKPLLGFSVVYPRSRLSIPV